jgi:outer membrane protein TolC
MNTRYFSIILCGISTLFLIGSSSAADDLGRVLTINEAVQIALKQDLGIKQHLNMKQAFEHKSKADKKLPDPVVGVGLNNFPTDTFERSQEPMTQIKVTYKQPLPRGRTLKLKSAKSKIMASKYDNNMTIRSLHTERMVRNIWLELRYWIMAESIVRRNKGYLIRALKITQDQYRTGRRGQQDVLRAQLEIDLLNDKLLKIQTMQGKARAALSKWIGMIDAHRALPRQAPALETVPNDALLRGLLKKHPQIISRQLNVDVKQKEVAIAKEAFKPQFAIQASYGERENRPDFASVGLAIKVPLSRKKYHYQLKSAYKKANAALIARDDYYKILLKQYEQKRISWNLLQKRYSRYRKSLLPRARANSKATLLAYRNGRTDFTTLIRARITELNIELQSLRVQTDVIKTQADLLYFTGRK